MHEEDKTQVLQVRAVCLQVSAPPEGPLEDEGRRHDPEAVRRVGFFSGIWNHEDKIMFVTNRRNGSLTFLRL